MFWRWPTGTRSCSRCSALSQLFVREGGIERWLVHTDGLGLDRDYVVSTKGILPATRFAVEAYVRFVYECPVLEGIASSLTEMFAPAIHRERIDAEDHELGGVRLVVASGQRVDVGIDLNDFDAVLSQVGRCPLEAGLVEAKVLANR